MIYDPTSQRQLYVRLMEELKRRRNVIADVIMSKFSLPQAVAVELCYLQFRMICELIALACLTAHGDIPATRSGKVRKEYRPGTILTALESLHPDFYPFPSRQVLDPTTGKVLRVERIHADYLTKDELIALWTECGNVLHRGSMNNIERPFIVDFKRIAEWDAKITRFLSHHQIQLFDERYQLWVIMQAHDDGKVRATLMRKTLPSSGG